MTTRQLLNQRFFRGWLALVAAFFVLGVCEQTVQQASGVGWSFWTLGLLTLAAVVWYRWRTPCLNCGSALAGMALLWRPAAAPNSSPRCPHCYASIDRDMEAAEP